MRNLSDDRQHNDILLLAAALQVTLTASPAGSAIYYTTDGSMVAIGDYLTDSAQLYSGPLTVPNISNSNGGRCGCRLRDKVAWASVPTACSVRL